LSCARVTSSKNVDPSHLTSFWVRSKSFFWQDYSVVFSNFLYSLAAMLAAAALSAAVAQMAVTSEYATQLPATMQALASTIATHAPCASPSQSNHLIEEILATFSHQEKPAPVKAVHVQSLSTNAPTPIIKNQGSSPIIMDQGLLLSDTSYITDARHFVENTPQGELPVKAPLLLEAFHTTWEGQAKENHV